MERPLDRTDFAILAELQNDARLSNKELAARVHLAPSSCLERVRRLREAGVLRGFHADVDPAALGIGLQAMIAIRMREHAADFVRDFQARMIALPEVVATFYLAGGTDFMLHVAVRDAQHLRDIAVDTVATQPGVAHVETSLIFEHHEAPGLPNLRPL